MKKLISLVLAAALVMGMAYGVYTVAMQEMIQIAVSTIQKEIEEIASSEVPASDMINVSEILDVAVSTIKEENDGASISDIYKNIKTNIGNYIVEKEHQKKPDESKQPTDAPPSDAPNEEAPPTQTEKPKEDTSVPAMFRSVPPEDRAFVMGIYGRFSAGEVSRVSSMMSGGITAEEKKQIKAIIYAKVSSAEVSRLLKIAAKM